MKNVKILLITLFVMITSSLQANTIHWLTFIDTTDPSVGMIDINSRNLLYSRWIESVNAVLNQQGYNINVIDVYGLNTSPANCQRIVENLQCGKNDIIVFYYIGHGTENTNTSRFPNMCMASRTGLVPLDWVHKELTNKGARLTISIGMCCNSRDGVRGQTAPSFSSNYGAPFVSPEMESLIKKLFLGYRGDLKVTSASPTESSWTYCSKKLGWTDCFTMALLEQFNVELLDNGSSANWNMLLQGIKESVRCKINEMRAHGSKATSQTPIWESNLESYVEGQGSVPTPDPIIDNNDKAKMKTLLGKAFAFISSAKVREGQRIDMATKIENIFANNAIVKAMSQDGDFVVDREDASTFLGRIATSHLLMNVSVIDFDLNQEGKIVSLKVRETYKRKR